MTATGKAEGASPAMIRDHPFTPEPERLGVKRPWWGLCGAVVCGMAESAHATTTAQHEMPETYRCPACVERGAAACSHRGAPLVPIAHEGQPEPVRGACTHCGGGLVRTGDVIVCVDCTARA